MTMCAECVRRYDKESKDPWGLRAIPVRYERPHGVPLVVSRRLNKPRRNSSRAKKTAGKQVYRIFFAERDSSGK
jgi:hypothetical protein